MGLFTDFWRAYAEQLEKDYRLKAGPGDVIGPVLLFIFLILFASWFVQHILF